ncbi:hypothetical protein L249_6315 [Ophiocordyceps polyrhachis-furcata BCC 54312]|uniref:Fork-head domain-containing protein n=1 Tax=Ophiocordyceps polyrhachis-furcata BCC 54312 TaxID=1330021 RepID=A0A367L154_9HYPO|nr:hypothetical protein L249_6315 [Ophiocordyceps polyrhachis-furcata BCC 54312]
MASTSDGVARDRDPTAGSDMDPPAELRAVDKELRAVDKDDEDDDDDEGEDEDEDDGDDDDGRDRTPVAAANESCSAAGPETIPTANTSAAPSHAIDSAAAAAASPPARPSTPLPGRRPPDSIPPLLTRSSVEPDQVQHHHPAQDPENTMTDPLGHLTTPAFTASGMASMNREAYCLMMAIASVTNRGTPPPTVTPSQVTLPNAADRNQVGLNHGHGHGLGRHAVDDNGLESFSRIEFADSVFQMTTHSVIIGRDQRALEQARLDEKRALDYRRLVEDNVSRGLAAPPPIRHDRCKFSKSYVSEEGGMLGPESDSEDSGRPPKRRKTSSGPSSYVSNNDDAQDSNIISDRQYVSHTPGAAAVDLTNLRPSPSHTPFIGIHSPGPDIAIKTKAISREHLKIAYNEVTGVFEAIPLHKNGFFCEDVHHKNDTVVLRCGDRLQIKDVGFRFIINGVEKGCTGAEEEQQDEAAGGKDMSFDFEQSHSNGNVQYTSDELSELVTPPQLSDPGDAAESEQPGPEAETEERRQAPEPDPAAALLPQPPKKRGPGRPPKNGIMSKREQRLLKKQQQLQQQQEQEQEQQRLLEQRRRQQQQQQQQEEGGAEETLSQPPPAEPPPKRKVGRPRKHPLPEDGSGDRPEKRRYKPRKPKNEDGLVGSDAERRAREKKDKKGRPKSPPLELNIEDYSEEQLQKPSKNYGVLIDETLTAAGPEGLTLKQIYKRISQHYPWFFFHTETKGWESSVRHNLIGNEAFKKDEATNLWSRVPGVELDAGKKRKVASPDRVLAAQQAYGPYGCAYGGGGGGGGGGGAQQQQQQQQQQQMLASGYAPGYHPMPGFPTQPPRPPVPPSAPPTGLVSQQLMARPPGPPPPRQVHVYVPPPPAPARTAGAQAGPAYSSPYASRPPALAPTPVKADDGVQAGASLAPVVSGPASRAGDGVEKATAAQPLKTTPPVPAAPARPVVDQRLLQAVVDLKNGLISNLKRAHNPQAEAIVMSALNRVIGLKQGAGSNDNLETICMKGISQVIEGYLVKNKSPAASKTAADAPTMLDAQVLKSLNGFKMVSIKALKPRLGEARAEDMALSAIDRVLGLADASSFASTAQQGGGGNFDGVEQHLMKSVRQLLVGMNQQLFQNQPAPPQPPTPPTTTTTTTMTTTTTTTAK